MVPAKSSRAWRGGRGPDAGWAERCWPPALEEAEGSSEVGRGEDGVVRANALGRLWSLARRRRGEGGGRGEEMRAYVAKKTFPTKEEAGPGRGWVGEWESGRGQRAGARGGAKVHSLGGSAGPRNWAVHRVGGGAVSVSAPRTAARLRVLSPSWFGEKETYFQSLEVDVSYWG